MVSLLKVEVFTFDFCLRASCQATFYLYLGRFLSHFSTFYAKSIFVLTMYLFHSFIAIQLLIFSQVQGKTYVTGKKLIDIMLNFICPANHGNKHILYYRDGSVDMK